MAQPCLLPDSFRFLSLNHPLKTGVAPIRMKICNNYSTPVLLPLYLGWNHSTRVLVHRRQQTRLRGSIAYIPLCIVSISVPLETVYGLGANALSEAAVLSIFEVSEKLLATFECRLSVGGTASGAVC